MEMIIHDTSHMTHTSQSEHILWILQQITTKVVIFEGKIGIIVFKQYLYLLV